MGNTIKIAVRSVIAALVVVVAAAAAARSSFQRQMNRQVDDLLAAASAKTTLVTEEDVNALPPPVTRWLRAAGVAGRPIPAVIRLKQEGELRLGDRGWFPFTARQYYTTDPPGFVWSVEVAMGPLVTVVGRDAYLDGAGNIDMRLLGLFPVARDSGPALDEGALLRYLNEIMWFPAAAINPGITWEGIDDASARATLCARGHTVSAIFSFDNQGRLTTMTANRYDREDGRVNQWSTPITAYGEFAGIRVPVAGEGVYARAAGPYPYIKLRLTTVEYDQPRRF